MGTGSSRLGVARRRLVVSFGTLVLAVGAIIVPMAVSAAASTTNADPTTFFGVACQTLIPITLDINSQLVVPNVVNQGDTYTATVPAGVTSLPAASSGFSVLGYKNLSQS